MINLTRGIVAAMRLLLILPLLLVTLGCEKTIKEAKAPQTNLAVRS